MNHNFADLISASMGLKLAEKLPDGTTMDDNNAAEYDRYRVALAAKRTREENRDVHAYQDEIDQLDREAPLTDGKDAAGRPNKVSRAVRAAELRRTPGMWWEPTRWLMGAADRSRSLSKVAVMIGPKNHGITMAGLIRLFSGAEVGMNVRYQMNYRSGWTHTWSGLPQNHPGGRLRDCMDAAILVLDRLQLLAHESQETRDAVRLCIDRRGQRPCMTVLCLMGTVTNFADVMGIDLYRSIPEPMRYVAAGAGSREP